LSLSIFAVLHAAASLKIERNMKTALENIKKKSVAAAVINRLQLPNRQGQPLDRYLEMN
jgi:hypothetical protein